MFKPERCIIIGSGYSIRNGDDEALSKDLPIWNTVKNEFTISMNYNYKFFPEPTIHAYGDWAFYKENKKAMDKLPLIIAPAINQLVPSSVGQNVTPVSHNTILLKKNQKYKSRNSFTEGVYGGHLVGLFMLTVAVALGFKDIYLLGYDFGGVDGHTHYYEKELKHRGVGMRTVRKRGKIVPAYNTSTYSRGSERYFSVFRQELDRINIVNVSPQSKIEVFPKISHKEFEDIINKDTSVVLQSVARNWVFDLLEKNKIV